MSIDPRTLHEIERRLIIALARGRLTVDALTKTTGLSMDQVRRGIEWLKSKNLLSASETSRKFVSLGSEGQIAIKNGLPERRFVSSLPADKEVKIADAKTRSGLNDAEFNAAFSNARAQGWITSAQDKSAIKLAKAEESAEEKLLRKIASAEAPYDYLTEDEIHAYQSLKKRPDYLMEREEKSVSVELSQQGLAIVKDVSVQQERMIDVTAPAPVMHAGRKHPLQDVIDEVREVFVSLGFEEIEGPVAQNAFWNFDALFTPQDHPAREMQDTFYVAGVRADNLASKNIISKVAAVHRDGWNYKWSRDNASAFVLRTHTTPVTIRYLADERPECARVFCIGRVFRNEKLTYKHLAEFYQVEGIVVGKDVTLRDLMGLQTEFYSKIGLKRVKFWPSYFPYTEPSLQSMVYHEKLGKWVELFGMGIFRPEVTQPLGIKNPVLAWGGGLERIAMLKYGLDDVRELYGNKLGWLRSVPKCQL